jgi:hypothetical protein
VGSCTGASVAAADGIVVAMGTGAGEHPLNKTINRTNAINTDRTNFIMIMSPWIL